VIKNRPVVGNVEGQLTIAARMVLKCTETFPRGITFVREFAFRAAFLELGLVLVSIALWGQSPPNDPKTACSRKRQASIISVDQFLFRTYRNDQTGDTCLQVSQNGRIIFKRTMDNGGRYVLGQSADPQFGIPAIKNGTDVTGRGHPDMIVSLYTGGAHCCMFHYVFELEPAFRLLATLNDADDDLSHFSLLGDEGQYYFVTADWTFAYWPGSFASSPNHSVVLRFVRDDNAGGYHIAWDKMRRPAPTSQEWDKDLAEVRRALNDDGLPGDRAATLWNEVLDLIYTGHSELAWKFLDDVGPKAQESPFPNLADFCSLLKRSIYWPDLAATLKDVPAACANAKP
jgi:hypothetical protein